MILPRRVGAVVVLVLLLTSWVLGASTAFAQAPTTPAPAPSSGAATLAPTESAPAASDPATADPGAAVTEEFASVEGAANPLDAPLLMPGTVVDTILQTEILYYAIDALPGQRVAATVTILGRPDGPQDPGAMLEVILTDAQRQPLNTRTTPFVGNTDALIELPGASLPVGVVGEAPLLSVSLPDGSGAAALAGTGYRLQLSIVVDGTAAAPPTAEPSEEATEAPQPDVTVTEGPTLPPGPADPVADLAPVALIALAVGGVAGFELSRRGL